MYRVTVPAADRSDEEVEYIVQLPPEYDPYRRYPCIVALRGLGMPDTYEIDWWCGSYVDKLKSRIGPAARNGYIVITPKWMSDDQLHYNYSEVEHHRVLKSLRDAYRKLSIDTDRVYITGHYDGGGAAWDIALSHPDLWAGAILLSPVSEKYILLYGANATYVPTYTVWGQFDSTSFATNLGFTVNDYLKSPAFDARGVEYKGRPRDHFLEEIPRIMDWMEMTSHRRDPNPKELQLNGGARPGDRFYYWFEMAEVDPRRTVSPVMFEMKRNKIDVKLQPNGSTFNLSNYPAKQVWIWLRPGLVNFGQTVIVETKGSNKVTRTFKGDLPTLLEDVRTRGDRLSPFYERIEIQ